MVATRKSLPSAADDDPDPQDPKVRATLRRLKIDGTDALKGDRSVSKPAAPTSSSRKIYRFRGAQYEVIGNEPESWLEQQQERQKSKDNSLPPDAKGAGSASARGKKRKRERDSVDSQDLRNIPPHKSPSVVATREADAPAAAHPLANSTSADPDTADDPPARRPKLDHVRKPKKLKRVFDDLPHYPLRPENSAPPRSENPPQRSQTRELTAEETVAALTQELGRVRRSNAAHRASLQAPEVTAESSIAALTEELERAAAEQLVEDETMPRIRDTPVVVETAQPEALTKGEVAEVDEVDEVEQVAETAPRRSRRSFRPGLSSTPRTRRTLPKRGSRAFAKDAEPTRDDAIDKDFDLLPLATDADILKTAMVNLKRDLKRASNLTGTWSLKYRSYKRLHMAFNDSTGKVTGQTRAGAAQEREVNGTYDEVETPEEERPSSTEPQLNGDIATSDHESSATSPSNSAYHSPMQERTHLHQPAITSAPIVPVETYKPYNALDNTWNAAGSWGKLRLSQEGRAEMALHRPRISEPWPVRNARAFQELSHVVRTWDEMPMDGNGDARGGAHR